MHRSVRGRSLRGAATVAVLALGFTAAVVWLRAEAAPAAAAEPDVAKHMIGTWLLAGTPDKPEDPPKKGGRQKSFTGKHWMITDYDADTGEVVFHHGGTYTLDGDEYSETIVYANKNTAELIGKTFKFKVKVEKDVYTQVGDGNPFTERWARAK